VNLGTPFVMHVEQNKTDMKGDGFLPRLNHIECYHRPGNCLFGIKFKVSQVIFEKKINFSEYSGTVFPLSYLLDQTVISSIKQSTSFHKRVQFLIQHYEEILDQHEGSLQPIQIVISILKACLQQNNFNTSVEDLAEQHHVSTRTLQRYFETATGISSKKALQVLRIRKAVAFGERKYLIAAELGKKCFSWLTKAVFTKEESLVLNNSTVAFSAGCFCWLNTFNEIFPR